MNVLTDTFRGLVRRRLWPVAVLLIAALAAVPTLLSKAPEPAPVAPTAPVTGAAAPASAAAQTALVAAGDDAQSGHRRYVLGAKKDPFAPAPLPKVKKHKASKAKAQTATAAATPAPATGPGSSGGSGSVPPISAAPAVPKPTYPAKSLTVRFGPTSGALTARTLEPDHPLPSASNPVLIYTGLENGGKTAVFMLGADVTKLEGDGRCAPDPESCDTLRLNAGETEFISVGKTQYELDVDKIHVTKSSSAKAATAHAARRAKRPKVHF
jgi:hypothetical protein